MKNITAGQIEKVTGGRLLCGSREAVCGRVERNSKESRAEDVFFAIVGENRDGHEFLEEVFERGCRMAVVSDEAALIRAASGLSEEQKSGITAVLVPDTVTALQDLAAWYLTTFQGLAKIGVTGSTGKTTTRDMLYYVLSEKYKTGRSLKNYNNLIGLPLSILELPDEAEATVLEMGMDRLGEIHRLVEIVRPEIGVITNVGITHIETLGSRENILRAKMEITDFFGEQNLLIINEDYDLLTKETAAGNYRLITTGTNGKSNFILSDICDYGENGIEFTLEHACRTQRFSLPVPGRHNAYNAALAVAAGFSLGVSMEEAAAGLKKLALTEKRLAIKGKDGVKVIDDTYNASPVSMKAGIQVLMSTKGMRKVAVLGDMFGLGRDAEFYHRQTGREAALAGVDLLVAVGDNARYMAEEAAALLSAEQALHFETKEDFLKVLPQIICRGDVVLVKGSRAMTMEKIVKKILE